MTWLAFLVAVAYFPGVPSASLVGRWWVVAAGAAVLLIRTPRLRPTLAHWVGLVLLLWCVASVLWSWSRWDTLGELVHILALAGVFCAAAEVERGEPGVMYVPSPLAFGIGLLPSAAVAVAQQLGWQPVLNISDHPVGLFLSKNAATEAAVPVLVWCVVSWFSKGGDAFERLSGLSLNVMWPRSVMLLVGASALLLAGLARAAEAWLMLIAAVFMVAWHWAVEVDKYPPAGARHRFGVVAFFLGAALLGVVVTATWPEQATQSLNERLAIWQVTLATWWVHPWLGWGLGAYGSLLPEFEYAHNDYFQVLFELGPVGLALMVAFLAAVFWTRGGGLAERAALASLLASALVWWPLHQGPASGFLVALLAGGLAGAGARGRVAEPERRADGDASIRPPWGHGARAVWPAAASWDHMAYG